MFWGWAQGLRIKIQDLEGFGEGFGGFKACCLDLYGDFTQLRRCFGVSGLGVERGKPYIRMKED